MKEFVLYGNGGHSRVVQDLIYKLGGSIQTIFDQENIYDPNVFPNAEIIICIGNNEIREKISKKIKHKFATLIHPSATLAINTKIEEGSIILANAVLQAGTKIGKHVIINAHSTIDHDVVIEDFVSIYPNTYIGGESKITKNKVVRPNQVIARNSIF
ncbi:transferase [Elizabethkingia anophelis]|jgi:UDP-3-O-[3-hydroxymyristoyl] glucosamine N-acyltransferase|uniref:PglD-related sugar-binding protein n=1 Tax=Elizabethkingia anophelis TaxID=1117645 RepID=UPI0035572A56